MMARFTQAGVQWWVVFIAGTLGFVKVMTSSVDPIALATCVGMMTTPAVFARRDKS